jgi:hypothetical protein
VGLRSSTRISTAVKRRLLSDRCGSVRIPRRSPKAGEASRLLVRMEFRRCRCAAGGRCPRLSTMAEAAAAGRSSLRQAWRCSACCLCGSAGCWAQQAAANGGSGGLHPGPRSAPHG